MARERPAGVPVYNFESLLGLLDLATATMLRVHRKQPAPDQKPVGCYYTGYEYALLYKAAEAVAMAPLSPGRQRMYDAARRCADCGKTKTTPFEKGPDGSRYCPDCQEPAAKRLWDREQAFRQEASAVWAREILADPTVVLVHETSDWWSNSVLAETVSGEVLVDVRAYRRNPLDPHPTAEQLAVSVSYEEAAESVKGLAGRRVVPWAPWRVGKLAEHMREEGALDPEFTMRASDGDAFGERWSNWRGEHSGGSYRYGRKVRPQHPPNEPAEVLAVMRAGLAEMSASATEDGA